MRTNGCVNFVHALRTLQWLKMPPEKSRKSRLTPKKEIRGGGVGSWGVGVGGGLSKLPILVVRRHEQRQRRNPERTLHGTPNRDKHLMHDFGKTKTFI